jgi:hypothetical protein
MACVPVLLLTRALSFLAEAVVFFAMLMCQYFLGPGIFPTMVHYLLRARWALPEELGEHAQTKSSTTGGVHEDINQLNVSQADAPTVVLERLGWSLGEPLGWVYALPGLA